VLNLFSCQAPYYHTLILLVKTLGMLKKSLASYILVCTVMKIAIVSHRLNLNMKLMNLNRSCLVQLNIRQWQLTHILTTI
jgi:hypothetical protein